MTKRAGRGHASAQVKREHVGMASDSFLKMFGSKRLAPAGPVRKDVVQKAERTTAYSENFR